MPSFIAHSAAGYAVFRIFRATERQAADNPRVEWLVMAVFAVVFANLPDFDFVPQLIASSRYHHGATHSITVWLILSALLWMLNRPLERKEGKILTLAGSVAYGSHLLLDYFGTGDPGIQALWPFTSVYFISQLAVFPPVDYTLGLIQADHLRFVGSELVFAILAIGVVALGQRLMSRNSSASEGKGVGFRRRLAGAS